LTLVGCCVPVNSDEQLRSELAKLRYAFLPQTSFTASYLGGMGGSDLKGLENYAHPTVLDPPASYAGRIPAGTDVSCYSPSLS